MIQLSHSLGQLVEAFAPCFRIEVFQTFRLMVAAWVVCPGRRTISEVWQATGQAGQRHHDCAYSLFRSAKWDWDELAKILMAMLIVRLVPAGIVWLVVDDTLSHKRGAKVAFGGMFLDPVTSSKRHKNFRFGLNWVVLGLAVQLPFRPDRTFCLPVLWRVFRKKGVQGHQKRTEMAAELAHLAASWLPGREVWLVGDSAYVNAVTLKNRPVNLRVIGPIRPDAALYGPPPPRQPGQRGAPRKRGDRLPTPKQMLDDPNLYPITELEVSLPGGPKRLRTRVVSGVQWYTGAGQELVSVVLVRDPSGSWKDGVLLATAPEVEAAFVIAGYCRRWSIEVAFHDSKQYLGLHEPQVRNEESVERAHPMAWFVMSLSVLWYAETGKDGEKVERERPWYTDKPEHTFTDMLGMLRLQLWRERVSAMSGDGKSDQEVLNTLLHCLAAVR